MASIGEIRDITSELFKNREEARAHASDCLETAQVQVKESKQRIERATMANDPEEYADAKDALATAEAAAQMHKAELDELDAAPIVTEGEYKKLEAAMNEALNAEALETEAQLADKCEEIRETAGKLQADKETAEATLSRLNSDMKKHKARNITAQIQRNPEAGRALNWSRSAIESDYYIGYCVRSGRTPKK